MDLAAIPREALEKALQESVKLQAHYAKLLNMHDGGERLPFESAEAWVERLYKTGTLKAEWVCLICLRPVFDYTPDYCCNGQDCGCMGRPLNPCVCSPACSDALMTGIGTPFDDRRKAAGITRFMP